MGGVSRDHSVWLLSDSSHAEVYVACGWGPAAAVGRFSLALVRDASAVTDLVITCPENKVTH